MKISSCMCVVNGRPFIKAQLDNVYDISHEIIICEGGDKFWKESHGFSRSNDGTIDIIKEYPDPKNKIRLIQRNWPNKNKMTHWYSKLATGDIIYHIDIDEFLTPKHIVMLCRKLYNSPRADAIANKHIAYFGDFNTIMVHAGADFWINMPRIHKRKPGLWIHHLPAGSYYNPNNGAVLPCATIKASEFAEKHGIRTHHYSYVYKRAVLEKLKYYTDRGWGKTEKSIAETIINFDKIKDDYIKNKTKVRKVAGTDMYLASYNGPHLPIEKKIRADLKTLPQ